MLPFCGVFYLGTLRLSPVHFSSVPIPLCPQSTRNPTEVIQRHEWLTVVEETAGRNAGKIITG
jgi:hypothetical protein